MQALLKEATGTTPRVRFDANEGIMELEGRSIPENATVFYYPLLDWLTAYVESPKANSSFTFYLEYINSISQKLLFEIVKKIQLLQSNGTAIEVIWKYDEDDEEMLEEGEMLMSKFDLEMRFVAVQE